MYYDTVPYAGTEIPVKEFEYIYKETSMLYRALHPEIYDKIQKEYTEQKRRRRRAYVNNR